jgi:pyruvate,water dikinase
MSCTILFEQVRRGDVQFVGGKGLSLGLMSVAGLPVPPGFCIAGEAYRRAIAMGAGAARLLEADLAEVVAAYESLGRPIVAVRSSATVEDGGHASYAGQQETVLGVDGEPALIAAVEKCWLSLQSDRALAYRREQNVTETEVSMAVVVQNLVPAEVAGVLFTRDPLDASGGRMLVEAAWGLGEAVVSGRVSPDRFHVARESGTVIDQHVSVKREMLAATGWCAVESERQSRPCLDANQLRDLAALGRRIESFFGEPRDVEWAWDGRQFWLLQARPITAADAFEREQVLREEISALRAKAAPTGTVWSRYNLAEVLPTPTPMTWSIVRQFMSGRGGYGLMYRDLGYDPDNSLDDEGFIDLVCGRPYVNLSQEPRLYFKDFPFGYDVATLKAHPERAMYPTPTVDRSQMTPGRWLKLPLTMWCMLRAQRRANSLRRGCATRLRSVLFPEMFRRVESDRAVDMTGMSSDELLIRLRSWCDFTLVTFARESLRPAVFAGTLLQQLDAMGIGREAMSDVRPASDTDLGLACQQLATGAIGRDEFVRTFGHRGPNEMDLAEPRWAERPEAVAVKGPSPLAPLAKGGGSPDGSLAPKKDRDGSAEKSLHLARELLAVREEAKHYFMLGYSMIRRYLIALDERHQLGGGVFYLTVNELPRLIAGEDFGATIRDRRRRRKVLLSLDVPPVLFSDDLDAIGRPIVPSNATELRGTPVSAGVFEGTAVVLDEPTLPEDAPAEFVLVCPSTDPAWVPIFLRAKALVMESGGVLSHGAIVAREFGLPAVAGLPGVQRQLCNGQRIRVDGTAGVVYVLDGSRRTGKLFESGGRDSC